MKRVRERTFQPSWPQRVLASWEGAHIPSDTWKLVYTHLDDFPSVLALGRVNLALYMAFGGFEKHLDVALSRGYYEIIDRARRGTTSGDNLFHLLKWSFLTRGEHDDSLSLFQKLTTEMDLAEPNLRLCLAQVDFANMPPPFIAGGFVRTLMLRLLRRVGVATHAAITEAYSDIDVWLEPDHRGWLAYKPLVASAEKWDPHSISADIWTFYVNTWSEKPVQFILAGLSPGGNAREYPDRVLYYFDFTCCQVGLSFREWDNGEVTLTPAFAYSLLTGCMFEGRPRLNLPYPFQTIEPEPLYFGGETFVSEWHKARMLSRFFKYMRLGYRDPTLSAYDVARMERIFKDPRVQAAVLEDDKTNYLLFETLI